MISRGRIRRGYWQRRRRKQNALPAIVMIALLCLAVGWGTIKIWNALGQGKAQQASAMMKILQGSTEFSSAGSDTWISMTNDVTVIDGDRIRTQNNSEVLLEFLDRNSVFLNENTEVSINSFTRTENGKNKVELTLHTGEIWAKIDDADFSPESGSSFVVESPYATTYAQGTIFDLRTTENQDTMRLIDGKVDMEIFHAEDRKESTTLSVGVGQKLIINEGSIDLLKNNADVLDSIDQSFQESDWNLRHLEQFSPDKAAKIKERIQLNLPPALPTTTTDETTEELPANVDPSIESPQILNPENNASIPASAIDMIIEGTAPSEAEFITVNGYTLTKYIPGDKKWSYFAATKFGTLVPGENTYTVIATTRDGRASPPTILTVNYEGTATETSSGNESDIITPASPSDSPVSNFPKPVVTRPAASSFGDPFQTSSKIITIAGTVDPTTQAVEVNGFRLRKFSAGDAEFSYIANANYGNLKEGLNVFTIKAFGPNDVSSTSEVSIIYTPIDIE